MPVLTTAIVRDCFYLFIFYSEKFSTRVWRLPFAVNVNLNLSILLFLTRDFLCHVQGTEIYRDVLQAYWIWIRDILIEFTERFFSALSQIKLPQFLVGFEINTLPCEQTFPSFMAFSVYDWSRSRGLSVAWLVCLRPTTLQTSHENDFVNAKSHAREKPLLAGYKNACHS